MPGRSLESHFRNWIVGGCVGLALACVIASFLQHYLANAQAQDERLAAAAASGRAVVPGMLWCVQRADTDPAAGDSRICRLTAQPMRDAADVRIEFAELEGQVLRAAFAEGAVFAEPARDRLPRLRETLDPWVLAFLAATVLMAAVSGWAARVALKWLARSLARFDAEGAVDDAPAELKPALEGAADLRERGRVWVEEQRSFLADAAHQLRTPMAVLRAEVQEALQSDGDPQQALKRMLHTVDRATLVANQLLSLSRVEQLRRSGELGHLDLGRCVREAIVELSPLIAEKRLDFSLDGDDFEALGDPVMMGELLRNLLGNAIHHSAPGARGGVVLRTAPHKEVIVWDEGPGIADAFKPRLFTPFSAGRGGVGLGLSICQQIATAMGAQVSLYNRLEQDRISGVDAVVRWRAVPP